MYIPGIIEVLKMGGACDGFIINKSLAELQKSTQLILLCKVQSLVVEFKGTSTNLIPWAGQYILSGVSQNSKWTCVVEPCWKGTPGMALVDRWDFPSSDPFGWLIGCWPEHLPNFHPTLAFLPLPSLPHLICLSHYAPSSSPSWFRNFACSGRRDLTITESMEVGENHHWFWLTACLCRRGLFEDGRGKTMAGLSSSTYKMSTTTVAMHSMPTPPPHPRVKLPCHLKPT